MPVLSTLTHTRGSTHNTRWKDQGTSQDAHIPTTLLQHQPTPVNLAQGAGQHDGIPGYTVSSAAAAPSGAIPFDDRPVTETQRLVIQIYALTGLAFFAVTVFVALSWYTYIICWNRKWRDLPEEIANDVSYLSMSRDGGCMLKDEH